MVIVTALRGEPENKQAAAMILLREKHICIYMDIRSFQ